LYHKSTTSQHDFFVRCAQVHYQTISRSKGLIEMKTAVDSRYTGGIRGLALEDICTQSPPQTVLADVEFRSWLKYKSMSFNWLHRSAYDYISGDLGAELPAWAQGVNTSLDMLSGCVWSHKYGLCVWTYNVQSHVYLNDEAGTCAGRIVDVVRSRGKAFPDDDYKALDNILSGLSSLYSDRWLQLYPNGQSRISCSMVHHCHQKFWANLTSAGFTDYVISRFEWLKRGWCAHCVGFFLLSYRPEKMGETLVAMILDYLSSELHADTGITTAPLPNLHENNWVNSASFKMYCVPGTLSDTRSTVSWLSHGKCDEYGAMCNFYRLASRARFSRSLEDKTFVGPLAVVWSVSAIYTRTRESEHDTLASTLQYETSLQHERLGYKERI
jgi:hypothetical protein